MKTYSSKMTILVKKHKLNEIVHLWRISFRCLWLLSLSIFLMLFERQINNWMSNCRDFDRIRLHHFGCIIEYENIKTYSTSCFVHWGQLWHSIFKIAKIWYCRGLLLLMSKLCMNCFITYTVVIEIMRWNVYYYLLHSMLFI